MNDKEISFTKYETIYFDSSLRKRAILTRLPAIVTYDYYLQLLITRRLVHDDKLFGSITNLPHSLHQLGIYLLRGHILKSL